MVPNSIGVHGSPGREKACHSSMRATSDPAIGVHKPARRSIPAPVESTSSEAGPSAAPPVSPMTPPSTDVMPAASRISKSPAPGAPLANVENNRRRENPSLRVGNPEAASKAPKGCC
jgi:hypothetical protein